MQINQDKLILKFNTDPAKEKDKIISQINQYAKDYKKQISYSSAIRKLKEKSYGYYLCNILIYISSSLTLSFLTIVSKNCTAAGCISESADSLVGAGGPNMDMFDEIFASVGVLKSGADDLVRKANNNELKSSDWSHFRERLILVILSTILIRFLSAKVLSAIDSIAQYSNIMKIFVLSLTGLALTIVGIQFGKLMQVVFLATARKITKNEEWLHKGKSLLPRFLFALAFTIPTITFWPILLESSLSYLSSINASTDTLLFVNNCFSTWFAFLGIGCIVARVLFPAIWYLLKKETDKGQGAKFSMKTIAVISFILGAVAFSLNSHINKIMAISSMRMGLGGLIFGFGIINAILFSWALNEVVMKNATDVTQIAGSDNNKLAQLEHKGKK